MIRSKSIEHELRNGSRSQHGVAYFLKAGKLPKGASYITRQMYAFRREVEHAIRERTGEVSLYASALIQSTIRHETRAQLLQRWLRLASDLTLAERVMLLDKIGAASDSRDRCLEKLKLDVKGEPDLWEIITQSQRQAATEAARRNDPVGDDSRVPRPRERSRQGATWNTQNMLEVFNDFSLAELADLPAARAPAKVGSAHKVQLHSERRRLQSVSRGPRLTAVARRTEAIGGLIDEWLAGDAPNLDIATLAGADATDAIEHLARTRGSFAELIFSTFAVGTNSLARLRGLRAEGRIGRIVALADAFMLSVYKSHVRSAVRATLATGDYSIQDHEADVVIERKSMSDLFSCVGQCRERFERELERMAAIPAAHLILEFGLPDIFENPPARSLVNPPSVIGSLLAWSARYGVHVWFAGRRSAAEWLAFQILDRWWKENAVEAAPLATADGSNGQSAGGIVPSDEAA